MADPEGFFECPTGSDGTKEFLLQFLTIERSEKGNKGGVYDFSCNSCKKVWTSSLKIACVHVAGQSWGKSRYVKAMMNRNVL
jgi:hypothetical protein